MEETAPHEQLEGAEAETDPTPSLRRAELFRWRIRHGFSTTQFPPYTAGTPPPDPFDLYDGVENIHGGYCLCGQREVSIPPPSPRFPQRALYVIRNGLIAELATSTRPETECPQDAEKLRIRWTLKLLTESVSLSLNVSPPHAADTDETRQPASLESIVRRRPKDNGIASLLLLWLHGELRIHAPQFALPSGCLRFQRFPDGPGAVFVPPGEHRVAYRVFPCQKNAFRRI